MAKIRVYQLAKELGVGSRAVLAWLRANDEQVRSASSTVQGPTVRRIRTEFEPAAADSMAAPVELPSRQGKAPHLPTHVAARQQTPVAANGPTSTSNLSQGSAIPLSWSDARQEGLCPVCSRWISIPISEANLGAHASCEWTGPPRAKALFPRTPRNISPAETASPVARRARATGTTEQRAAAWQKFQDRVATGPVDHDVYRKMSTTELVIEQGMFRRLSTTELNRPCTREWRRALATLLLQRTGRAPAKAKRNRHQKSGIHSRTSTKSIKNIAQAAAGPATTNPQQRWLYGITQVHGGGLPTLGRRR